MAPTGWMNLGAVAVVAVAVGFDAVGGIAAEPPAAAARQGISFSKQVAPILASKCGGCHIAGRKGGFQMASYAALVRSGMVQRGNGSGSRLMEVILSGDMPRGGGTVTPEEVGALMKWIDTGAAYDAGDPTTPIDALVAGGASPPPAPPPAGGPVPLEPGAVSFAVDVAPVLLAHCITCHDDRDPDGNLRMTTLESLLRGGRSKAAIVPRKGAESLLVRKLRGRGIEGQRMPLNKDPLPDDVIATIERWIDEGARLDLLTARTPLEAVAAAGRAKSLSDAELATIRFDAGRRLWQQAIPDEQPVVKPGAGCCVIGNMPPDRMAALAAAGEAVSDRVRKELVATGPLLKGGVVVFAFRQGYDYSALWQNVLGSERPKGLTGHAGVAGDVAYGAMLVPTDDESGEETRLRLAEQIVGVALAGREVPDWFARGAGRAVAAKVVPKAATVQQWRRELPAAVQRCGSAQDFLAGQGDPVDAALVAGGFVGAVATGSRLKLLVKEIDAGASFEEAFQAAFRAAPQQAFEAWAVKEARKAPRPH